MLKHILMSALLLAVPACANQDSPQGALPDLPGKVLIVGDAISLGFGAMGPDQNCPLTPEFNSVSQSYGVQVAEALGVDYVMFAWPGIGLVHNYGEDQTIRCRCASPAKTRPSVWTLRSRCNSSW
jgi:hypothetical protein